MTGATIPWFRELYQNIIGYGGDSLSEDVLDEWIDKGQSATSRFVCFASPGPYDDADESAQFSMWNLYALSRVNDLLLASFQRTAERKLPIVTSAEYETFFTRLGFRLIAPDTFSPLHHEITEVCQANDPDEPIGVMAHRWPGLMLGDMVFSRSGVEVIGGQNHIAKDVAEKSTLYFTFHRQHRRTNDLSMGWGSNSQWRTSFRRDYQFAGKRIYNCDGETLLTDAVDAEKDRDGLRHEERIELCKNRCFVVTTKSDDDLWPYDDRLEEVLE